MWGVGNIDYRPFFLGTCTVSQDVALAIDQWTYISTGGYSFAPASPTYHHNKQRIRANLYIRSSQISVGPRE